LAQLNGSLLNLPNPTLFLDTIYLQEAKASSEVENIIKTNDELYKSFVADRKIENTATKEVLCSGREKPNKLNRSDLSGFS
jgi:hypothetical protein